MAAHRDADVWRWAVAQRVAVELLRGGDKPGPRRRVANGVETVSVSAARDGAEGMKMIAQKRSEYRG